MENPAKREQFAFVRYDFAICGNVNREEDLELAGRENKKRKNPAFPRDIFVN